MLYGTIFGDIAGSAYEYRPVKNSNFNLITKFSRFTDDTVMTLAVAAWLLKDPEDTNVLIQEMQSLGRRHPAAGYGGSFRKWLISLDPKPYNSWGNGSAMRVSPCAWFAKSLEEAEFLAERSASVTHNHPEGIKGAKATAAAIYLARTNHSKQHIKTYIENTYGYNLNRTVQDIIDRGYKFEVSCQKSVPEAIIAFLDSEDFETTIRNAISLGGDSDTQAAIAGSIAEAFYGVDDSFKDVVKAELDEDLLTILNNFNNA